MKSKPLRYGLSDGLHHGLRYGSSDGRMAAARWGLSTALALGWLAALGVFATPGGSGGPAAPASRLGLVRLTIQQVAPPSAWEQSEAERKPRQQSRPENSTDARKATAPFPLGEAGAQSPPRETAKIALRGAGKLPVQETAKIAAQQAQPTVASREALDGTEGKPSPEPAPEPRLQPESEVDSQPLSAAANPLGRENGETSDQTAESTATALNSVQNSAQISAKSPPSQGQAKIEQDNTTRNNTALAGREMIVAQLDEGFGLLRPVRPAYPALAKRLGKAGRVRLELGIDPQGRVYRVNVVDEISGWGFGPSAESAYRNARFTRPTVGGRPVRVLWRKTVIFRP